MPPSGHKMSAFHHGGFGLRRLPKKTAGISSQSSWNLPEGSGTGLGSPEAWRRLAGFLDVPFFLF